MVTAKCNGKRDELYVVHSAELFFKMSELPHGGKGGFAGVSGTKGFQHSAEGGFRCKPDISGGIPASRIYRGLFGLDEHDSHGALCGKVWLSHRYAAWIQ